MKKSTAWTHVETSHEDRPDQVYALQLAGLKHVRAAEQHRERQIGYGKLIVAALTLIAALIFIHTLRGLALVAVPAALFVVLAVLQERRIRGLRLLARGIVFFERGLARMEGRWHGGGEGGERFLVPAHPYARDLDLFGEGSLFELLSTARTRAGEDTLAAWLLAAAPMDEVLARQEAVQELRSRVSFRTVLFSLGETLRLGVRPEELATWGERKPVFNKLATRVTTRVLCALWVGSLVAWPVWGVGDVVAAITILNLAWAHRIFRRLEEAAEGLEKAGDGLALLAGVLALLESETFQSAKLLSLQSAIRCHGIQPSAAIRKLARLNDSVISRHNPFARLLDIFTFWSAQLMFEGERWQVEYGSAIRGWLKAVGELEALTALAGFAYEHPVYVFPEVVSGDALFHAQGMAHPLLPMEKAVCNDVRLGDGVDLLILSGPNMAGKSTFIRSVGINAVLAQCGAPVRAEHLRMSPLTVAASICVLDSLSGGVSRFYAEIHRIKVIRDLADGATPVLFLLDELLSGTNSHDRLVGSEFIVRTLVERNAIGMISTHDLALTNIPETLGGRAANFHFEDRFADGQLIFDYKLKPGVVQTSNALELMRSIGLPVDTGP